MKTLRSPGEYHAHVAELKQRTGPVRRIRVCSTGCRAMGALDVCEALEAAIGRHGLEADVRVVRTGCHGFCAGAVTMVIDPEGIFYQKVTPEDAEEIIAETLIAGRVVERLCWVSETLGVVSRQREMPFYRFQTRLVLRNCGSVEPNHIENALAHGAYASALRALCEVSPQDVIEEVLASGLRGRGGAGFSTGRKWQFTRSAPGEQKYVVCNADEGDPGAFMDRALLEGDPHLVIEGMLIGAYAIGASKGFIYVRAEYPIAIEHTQIALAQAREAGFLGENILGAGFDFDIEIRKGAGAFVCGEETSLIASIEGKRGMPRPRPPFPAIAGIHGKPTNINNVETWANIPRIIEMGSAAYARVGTEGSKGTKIFALAGKVRNTGLVEVPMGTTLRQIIFEIGGGIPRDRRFKAAQIGGPSGGCVPPRHLDLPIDYDSVHQIGAIMGSGGLIVMDEATCMVDIAQFFTDFVQKESCGKCVPCRIGTMRMLEMLRKITSGQGELADLERLERLGKMIMRTSLCGLGQTAANPVISTLRYFRDEYEAHIVEKRCKAHACDALVTTTCSSACPAHVNVPEYVSLIAEGRFADAIEVIRRRNPFVSVCGRVCDHPCETFCRRGDLDEPVAVRQLKRFVSDQAAESAGPQPWYGERYGRVAVIGSGPAGLTAAYFLALQGRAVTVFEALDVAGGLLATGIPDYRLPREVLQRDIDFIERAGVEIKTGHCVKSLEELRVQGFDAIFIGAGAQEGYSMDIPGEQFQGVYDALNLLRTINTNECRELRGRVVVIGGGNSAIDSARSALRLGADSVTLLYRRTRQEMPALREEIEDALMEGVDMKFLVAPVAIQGDGRVRAVRCVEMELGDADESGRRRPVPKPDSQVTIPADHVIVAVGQGPELGFAANDGRLVVKRGKIHVHPVTQRSGQDEIFAGGDVVTGPSMVVEAIAAGQKAAQAIDIFLGGKGELPPDHGYASRCRIEEPHPVNQRAPLEKLAPGVRVGNFREVLRGYSERQACAEARRCLRCDLER